MIEAHRRSIWAGSYDLVVDGRPLTSFDRSTWRTGGRFELDGRGYELRSNLWASTYTLVADDGSPVATANRVGRKEWTVEAGSTTHTFRRVSAWRHEEELHVGGQRVGSVRRTSVWGGDAVADLPGLPPVVAVFALAVLLTSWDLASSGS